MYQLDVVHFDNINNKLHNGEITVALDKQTAKLLELLIREAGPVSKDNLITEIWSGRVISDAAITTAVRRLRKAIATCDDSKEYVETLPKVGYRLAIEVVAANDDEGNFPKETEPSAQSKSKTWIVAITLASIMAFGIFSIVPTGKKLAPETPQFAQAQYLWQQKNPELVPQAIKYLNQTLEVAPEYLPAHQLLAEIYSYKMSRYLNISDQEIISRAQFHIQKLENSPKTQDAANLSNAKLAFFYLRDLKTVRDYSEKYAESDNCDAECHFFIAYASPAIGQPQQGIVHAEKAYQLKPDSELYMWERMWSQFMAGNFDLAKQRRQQAADFTSNQNVFLLAIIAQAEGKAKEAMQYWLEAVVEYGSVEDEHLPRIKAMVEQGRINDAAIALAAVLDSSWVDGKALLYMLAGDNLKAMEIILESETLQDQTHLLWAHANPTFQAFLNEDQMLALRKHVWKSDEML